MVLFLFQRCIDRRPGGLASGRLLHRTHRRFAVKSAVGQDGRNRFHRGGHRRHGGGQFLFVVARLAHPLSHDQAAVLADSGFYSEAAVRAVEQTPEGRPSGTTVYAALEKREHHRTVSDLEKKEEPAEPVAGAEMSEVMKHRLKTEVGQAKYKLRQQTVEPVFGIIKSVMGFRQFLLRGLEKVGLEWQLVCVAYNLKRLHILGAGLKLVRSA